MRVNLMLKITLGTFHATSKHTYISDHKHSTLGRNGSEDSGDIGQVSRCHNGARPSSRV